MHTNEQEIEIIDEIKNQLIIYKKFGKHIPHATIYDCIAMCPTKKVWDVVPNDIQLAIAHEVQEWIADGRPLPAGLKIIPADLFAKYQIMETLLLNIKTRE